MQRFCEINSTLMWRWMAGWYLRVVSSEFLAWRPTLARFWTIKKLANYTEDQTNHSLDRKAQQQPQPSEESIAFFLLLLLAPALAFFSTCC